MDKLTKRYHEAARLRAKHERQKEAKELQQKLDRAFREGHSRGSECVRELERMMAHPVAQELLASAGQEFGRMIATKFEENPTSDMPGSVVYKCAEEVWSYWKCASAQPLEEMIKVVVNHYMERMTDVMRIDIPALSFSQEIPDARFFRDRKYG